MTRFGFGEKVGEQNDDGTYGYENGFVEVSNTAFKWASSQVPSEPPAGAIGLMLCELAEVDLSDHVKVPSADVDFEAVHEAVQDVEGVGEGTADEILEAMQEAL